MVGNNIISTVLPASYGESTALPGVPHPSCVAPLCFQPNGPGQISAFIIASSQEVFILGQNLQKPLSPITRRLWRPNFECCAEDNSGSIGSSSALGQPTDAASAQYCVCSVEGSMRIVAITAFLVHTDSSSQTKLANEINKEISSKENVLLHKRSSKIIKDGGEVQSCGNVPKSFSGCRSIPIGKSSQSSSGFSSLYLDTVCAVIAWEDSSAMQHLTFLFFSLYRALSPSCKKFLLWEQEANIQFLPDTHVVRIFHSPDFSAVLAQDESSCTREVSSYTFHHLVYISLCQQAPKGSKKMEMPTNGFSAGTTVMNRVGKCAFVSIREVFSTSLHLPSPSFSLGMEDFIFTHPGQLQHAQRDPQDRLLACWRVSQNSQLEIGIPCTEDIPNFLVHIGSIKGVVTCLEVYPRQNTQRRKMASPFPCSPEFLSEGDASVRAAIGTMDGRVYLLSSASIVKARRIDGPVADMKFFVYSIPEDESSSAKCSSVNAYNGKPKDKPCRGERRKKRNYSPDQESYRLPEIDALLLSPDEYEQKKPKSISVRNRSAVESKSNLSEKKEKSSSLDVTLVILDSIGKIILLRRVNTNCGNVQIVRDVAHVVTLLSHWEVGKSSASHSLLSREEKPGNKLCKPNSLSEYQAEMGPPHAVAVSDESMIAGNILSSGLLHSAIRYHPLQLIVSTMNRGIVILPFHPKEDKFSISSYTLYPTPVLYIGVSDLFATGAEDLLLAGVDSVLIARQTQHVQRRNAFTLLRLLSRNATSNALCT